MRGIRDGCPLELHRKEASIATMTSVRKLKSGV